MTTMATLAPSASTLSVTSAPSAQSAAQVPEHLIQERAQQIAAQNQGFRITAKGNALCLYCSCFMRRDQACASKTHRVLSEQQARAQLEREHAERAERSIGRRIGRVLRSLGSRNAARVAVASITALGGAGAMLAPHLEDMVQITAAMTGLR